MGVLEDKTKVAEKLNRELDKTNRGLGAGGRGRAPRSASVNDVGRLRGDIHGLKRAVDGMARRRDPFLTDLLRAGGPRRA